MTIGEPWQHPDTGRWMIPMRAENEDGSAVGVGWAELAREHPQYAEWVEFIGQRQQQQPEVAA